MGSGMRMVITGQLDSMYREDAQALIERHGGQVSGRVSSRGQYVVAGIDADTGERTNGSKIQKALRLGARIIDEDGLFELIAASRPQVAGQATASAAVGVAAAQATAVTLSDRRWARRSSARRTWLQ